MAFLQPVDEDIILRPDVVSDSDFKSIPFLPTLASDQYELQNPSNERAFLLMDENENLLVATPEIFCRNLRIGENDKIKVVAIFGSTGDGKSHTMNHTFFGGERVFKTSAEQKSCTIGVHAAMQPDMGILCLDTEGLLGTTAKRVTCMRMLLKILAISDIVIYRTRSERLHSDMYEFLGTASKAFCSHFAQALQSLAIPGTAKTLGPAVIIFHETIHTKPLENTVSESAEDKIRENFALLNCETNAFSSLRYVGIQTSSVTDYSKIISTIRLEIENTAVRSPRHPGVVFKAMKALNLKFSGKIVEKSINPFPEQYFTCTVHCESCSCRCQRSMGHVIDGENHFNENPCDYQHQFENKVYLCKACYNNGKKITVNLRSQSQSDGSWYGLAKYAWKGAVIDCPHCGEIYRARQYWYGNKCPEVTAVRSEIVHVWKGGNVTAKGPAHSAQIVLDSVTYISDTISTLSAQPTKALTGWLADKVAPSYWRPNHELIRCHACQKNFEKTGLPKHHCRGCGEGFCNACSQHKIPVPSRGWTQPVRVCNDCHQDLQKKFDCIPVAKTHTNSNHNCTGTASPGDEANILARKYGETIYNTISSVAAVAIEYPKEMIKHSARPDYWVPDSESPNCHICEMPFGTIEELDLAKARGLKVGSADLRSTKINSKTPTSTSPTAVNSSLQGAIDYRRHHCRRCGQAVCASCSSKRFPVPERGWHTHVRVCDSCACVETMDEAGKSKAIASTAITVATDQPTSVRLTTPDDLPRAKKND